MRVWENPNIENNAPMEIIQATVEHAEAVAKIYNYYIENSTATFETSAISAEQMRGRIAEISAEFPYIVGFEKVSEFGEVGYKFGRFLGIIDLELILGRKSAKKY